MSSPEHTWSAVRFGPDGDRRGWCAHKHRYQDTAVTCARKLNNSWAATGDTWKPVIDGHLRSAGADA